MENLMNIDPNTVFSTGQTVNDFIQLSKIYVPDSTAMNTQDIEAMIPPVLLNPNYIPSNRAPGLIVAHILPLILALACVCLRVYAKIKRFGRNGLVIEDHLIMVASVVMCVLAGIAVYGAVHLQQGYKVTDLTAHSLETSMKLWYGTTFLYPLATCIIRLSLILFFRRIYHQTGSRLIIFCNILMGLCICVFLCAQFAFGFACTPVRASWDIWLHDIAKCHILDITFANSLMTMILDLLILIVPIKLMMSVKGGWRVKAEVFSLFGVGIIAWTANILALWKFKFHYGQWSHTVDAEVCYFAECIIGIICSCAPAIRTLFPSSTASKGGDTTFKIQSGRVVRTLRKKRRPSAAAKVGRNENEDGDLEAGVLDGCDEDTSSRKTPDTIKDESFGETLSPHPTSSRGGTTSGSKSFSSTRDLDNEGEAEKSHMNVELKRV